MSIGNWLARVCVSEIPHRGPNLLLESVVDVPT